VIYFHQYFFGELMPQIVECSINPKDILNNLYLSLKQFFVVS